MIRATAKSRAPVESPIPNKSRLVLIEVENVNTEFKISCVCGASLVVRHTEAGSKIKCDCGKEIDVHRLAELRRNAGSDGIVRNPVEQVLAKINTNELPNKECVVCGTPAEHHVQLFAECELGKTKTTGGFDWGLLFATLFLPISIFSWRSEEHEYEGRDTVVPVPLTFCSACEYQAPSFRHFPFIKWVRILLLVAAIITFVTNHPLWIAFSIGFVCTGITEFILSMWNRSNATKLLRRVPEYSVLLDEYPDASIID